MSYSQSPSSGGSFWWFPLHAGNFLSQTASLSSGEVGCYILLRCYLLHQSRLPKDRQRLKVLCRNATWAEIKTALQFFSQDEHGFLFDAEIEALRCGAVELSEKRREAGKKGAISRWLNPIQAELPYTGNTRSDKLEKLTAQWEKSTNHKLTLKKE